MSKRVPLVVAIALLLLPVLYVGSYLAMVQPGWVEVIDAGLTYEPDNYRCNDETAERVFWPLEQIDRRVRPGAWEGRQFDR